ncbi:DUF4393 domain-containing protein [Chryseobacterium sp. WG23]|uniref:DUF4393 domain-containing protein n=1 Tax=Chryseobacterium sp. WG23 TaxID=2926910 RepID=UPI00211ECF24|nr:DUF4393 domain-containing protein [Chryseobacterium sp. WG23]MCQ9633637.1 DUF4393 domain-containing protein [Chryseobacterium sp. WG23]
MNENNTSPESNINSTINAITGLAKEIPVYQDAIQPSAQEIGKSLHTVTKTINIALAPIKILVWGYEKIEDYISKRVSEKLDKIPTENITTPDPKIAVPAIEALRYTGSDEYLRELYANLIANSMDKATMRNAHPGFVEILKNLTSDEAILLKAFILDKTHPLIDINGKEQQDEGFIPLIKSQSHFHNNLDIQNPDLIPAYLDNLIRLGILEIPHDLVLTQESRYEELENSPIFTVLKEKNQNSLDRKLVLKRKLVRTTSFGNEFIQSVVVDK